MRKIRNLEEVLRQCQHEIFLILNQDAITSIKDLAETLSEFKRGQTIFHQGNSAHGLYIVVSGKVKLYKKGFEAKETIIKIAGKGDILGCTSIFGHATYSVTSEAMEDTVVCFLKTNFIHESMAKYPDLSINLMSKLSEEMRRVEEHLLSMSQKSVRERISELLLRLVNQFGIQEERGWKLDLRLSREEIASLTGTAHETVIRLFSDLKEDGIVEQQGRYIYILDLQRLKKQALMVAARSPTKSVSKVHAEIKVSL